MLGKSFNPDEYHDNLRITWTEELLGKTVVSFFFSVQQFIDYMSTFTNVTYNVLTIEKWDWNKSCYVLVDEMSIG